MLRADHGPRVPTVCAHVDRGALQLVLFIAAPMAFAQIELPAGNLSDRIVVAADGGNHWVEGVYDVYLLHGNCYVNQGLTYARSRDAVIWIERGGEGGDPPHKVIAYLDGDVDINYQQAAEPGKAAGAATLKDKSWFGRFFSVLPVEVRKMKLEPRPAQLPAVYTRAAAGAFQSHRAGAAGAIRRADHAAAPRGGRPAGGPISHSRAEAERRQPRRRGFLQPGDQRVDRAAATGGQHRGRWRRPVRLDRRRRRQPGDLDRGSAESNGEGESFQAKEKPLEIYMEGNVVFRQGERTIYAQRMYYDVRRQIGIVLAAEMLTPVPKYEGLMQLRADVVQQIGRDRFFAQNALVTSSRFGVPRLRVAIEPDELRRHSASARSIR